MKKLVSLFLTLCLIVALLPVRAAAEAVTVTPGMTFTIPVFGTVTGNADGTVTAVSYNGFATVITPPEDGGPIAVDTGNYQMILIPEGSTAKTGDGAVVTLPQGGTFCNDGKLLGNPLQVGDVTVTVTYPVAGVLSADPSGSICLESFIYVMELDKGNDGVADAILEIKTGLPGVLKPDGDIQFQSGGLVTIPDTETIINFPDDSVMTLPDSGGVGVPVGAVVSTNDQHRITISGVGATVTGDSVVSLPAGGSAQIGNRSTGLPSTITAPAGGGTVRPNEEGEMLLSAGMTLQPNSGPSYTVDTGATVTQYGRILIPGGDTITVKDETGIATKVTFSAEGGTAQTEQSGRAYFIGCSSVQTDGRPKLLTDSSFGCSLTPDTGALSVSGSSPVILPGGEGRPDVAITLPSALEAITPQDSGDVLVPGGTKVKTGENGPEITVSEQGGTVDGEGSITVPGGGSVTVSNSRVGPITITVPESGGTVTTGENGEVTIPGGSTVQVWRDPPFTVPSTGGTIVPDGVVKYEVTVTFDAQGGSDVPSQTVMIGDQVTEPTEPTQNGHTFDGWYTEAACTTAWDFDDPVTGSMTLYAKWTKNPSPVTPPEPDDEPVWENPFLDVSESAWYYKAVEFANENGLFYGTSDTTFEPNSDMSRGMLATVIYRLAKEPGTTAEDLFNDVANDKYYTEAIAWAAENDIVAGYGNGRYGPDDPITREQLATILWRYADSPESIGNLDKFNDGVITSDWAVPALQWAVEQKIVSGKGNGILDPRGKATRAEVAAMLMRYIES